MPRFFLESIDKDCPQITGADAVHIGRSLRMRPGQPLTVCAGMTDYDCVITSITPETVFLEIKESRPCVSEPSVRITLFQAVPKLDKLEYIIQKCVELGVYEVVPIVTERCVSRPDKKDFSKKLERLNKISLEAAKQSGRGIVPRVTEVLSFKAALEKMGRSELSLMLYEKGGRRLGETDICSKVSLSLLVGSEGGFSREEAELAESSGVVPIWLGSRILRCETAPVAAMSILMYITKNL